jgi:hypothetical protein
VRPFLGLLAAGALAACGPIKSGRALVDADVELEAARAAGAQKAAAYEYTAAEAYLHQARLVAGRAQYEVAETYADKAAGLARKARQKALAASTRPPEAQ